MYKLWLALGLTITLGCAGADGPKKGAPGGAAGSGGTGGAGGSGGSGGTPIVADASLPGFGGSGGSSGNDGSVAPDAAPPADVRPADAAPPAGGNPAAALENQLIKVTCPAGTAATSKQCQLPETVRVFSKDYKIEGDPALTYKVKMKFCAVFEGLQYNGCTSSPDDPSVCIGGTRVTGGFPGTYPTLALKTADPARTYYLNKRADFSDAIFKFEYTLSFEARGGSTVSLVSDGGMMNGVFTARQSNPPPQCTPAPPGIEMQPYLGQYVYIQTATATP
jgi:hypothetical protein